MEKDLNSLQWANDTRCVFVCVCTCVCAVCMSPVCMHVHVSKMK